MVKVKVTNDSLSLSNNGASAKISGDEVKLSGKGGTVGLGSPPPSGLEPIGDTGLYGTVSPIDPRDCEHYPDSPYCGGNPLSSQIIGLDVDAGVDGCSAHVSVTPTLGFIKLPTQTIAYVKEECREKYEQNPEKTQPPPPPLPEELGDVVKEMAKITPQTPPSGFNPNDLVCVVTTNTTMGFSTTTYLNSGYTTTYSYSVKTTINDVVDPGRFLVSCRGFKNEAGVPYPDKIALANVFATCYGFGSGTSGSSTSIYDASISLHPNYPTWDKDVGQGTAISRHAGRSGRFQADYNFGICLYYGYYKDIFPSADCLWFYSASGSSYDSNSNSFFAAADVGRAEVVYIRKVNNDGSGPPQYKIPPRTKRKKCCMSCCSPSQQRQNNDNALLRQILRKLEIVDRKLGTYPFSVTLFDADDNKQGAQQKNVSVANVARGQKLIVEREEKNAKSIGIDQFPIIAPSRVVEDESKGLLGDLGDLKNKMFPQRIESIAELLTWKITNDNEIFGKWQEYIEIEDSEPTKEGNQRKRVVLPNMAKSFRELVSLSATQVKVLGYIFDTILKMYIDLANTKVSAATIEAIIRDVQDFLDYPTTEKSLNVPLGIRIPSEGDADKENLKRFLSNSHVKAKFDDWTGEGSIHDMLVVLLEAAGMIKAAMYNKT